MAEHTVFNPLKVLKTFISVNGLFTNARSSQKVQILFSRLRRPLGAYICERCRARTFAGSQWRGVSTNAPRETHIPEEKLVRRRIEQLGGAASLAQHYPRWKRPPDIEVMDASSFQAQWSAECETNTSRGKTISNNVILLYGIPDLPRCQAKEADRSRKSEVAPQLRIEAFVF